MRESWIVSVLLLLLVVLMLVDRSGAVERESLYGVSPQDESYYKGLLSAGTAKCRDGSKKFTKSQLNDDFCDCPDGSDEPGTSACPNAKFYCRNAGHAPIVLFSSRVNDGICDCCDGSDEYDGSINCPNTCWEAGKVARDKLKKKIATYQEGVTIRKREIEKAKSAIAKEEAELSKLKDEEKLLQGLVQQLKERKELIEKAEEKERLQKEKEEKERKEAEAAKEKETRADEKSGDIEAMQNDIHDEIGTIDQPLQDATEYYDESLSEAKIDDRSGMEELPDDKAEVLKEVSVQGTHQQVEDSSVDGKADIDTGNQVENAAEDSESLSREELGRRVASRWTGESTEQLKEDEVPLDKDHQNPDETSNVSNDEEYNTYDSEEDEHRYSDDDSEDHVEDFGGEDHYDPPSTSHKPESDDESDFADITSSSSSSWLEKIQQTVKSIFQSVNLFQTPVNISDATQVKKQYEESSTKLSKIQSRISKLSQKLKQDFGPDKEFYSFYGQCLESKQNKYVYKVCPYKEATQVEGYSTTRLGSWDKFEDSYKVMQFSNGDKCWNGPDRSLKVKLRCGLENQVADVDEPSRCEYLALLSTPALCLDTKLKELQEKLESLNKEQPQRHDEL